MTAQALTLTDFLLARIAEDEAAGRKAADDTYGSDRWSCELWVCDEQGSHVAIDPPRVLAECEAKRRIVERETERLREQWRRRSDEHRQTFDEWMQPPFGETLRDLAAVYRDHPDYSPDWRP